MTKEDFMKVVAAQHKRRISLLNDSKKSRTAETEDRLLQFKRMSVMNKRPLTSVPLDLCIKQFSDIIDMADGSHSHTEDISYLRELVSDVQNYLDILLALAEEVD